MHVRIEDENTKQPPIACFELGDWRMIEYVSYNDMRYIVVRINVKVTWLKLLFFITILLCIIF